MYLRATACVTSHYPVGPWSHTLLIVIAIVGWWADSGSYL